MSLFQFDKRRQECQFYNKGFLYELQSQLETMNDEEHHGKDVNPNHKRVIECNLPVLTTFCGMKPYTGDGSYQSFRTYLKEAETILSKQENRATLMKDALVSDFIKEYGKEAFLELKRNNYNISLDQFVTGSDQKRLLDIIDGHIVPRSGLIFLTPHSKIGRAPFYSSEKVVGSWHIKTLWFNLSVLLFMSILAIVLLLTDTPGRYLRERQL